MKTCPECSRNYPDEYDFCLEDGASLSAPLEGEQTELIYKSGLEESAETLSVQEDELPATVESPLPTIETVPLRSHAAAKELSPGLGQSKKILREILAPLMAVIAAFVVGGLIIALLGDNPFEAYGLLLSSSFGSIKDIGWTLHYATPLIFTGLAVAVAFRCGLLNIGAEGQLYVAAFAAAWVGIKFGGVIAPWMVNSDVVPDYNWSWASLPAWLLVPMCVLAAVVAGGIWGGIPGFLKAKFGSHEVINTIMLNFIAIALVGYFTQYYFKIPGDALMQTAPIGAAADIPRLNQFLPFIPADVPLNVAFLLAIVMCVVVYLYLWKTKWGYELRAVGQNPFAAEYGGISPKRQIIVAMTISGALA
ncbi:MAG TPA: ABC transporter permease, partial [Pyrinomonadaceae bacterium]|nr:ABC transporter permease [Pyrinomonadaceae bacterium]